jgi:hypothetical protein
MTPERRNSPLLDNGSLKKIHDVSMEMRIRGDRLGTERVSMSTELTNVSRDTNKQSTFSMETEDYISGRADKNEGIREYSFGIRRS